MSRVRKIFLTRGTFPVRSIRYHPHASLFFTFSFVTYKPRRWKASHTIAKMFKPQNRVVLGLLLTVALTSGEILNRGWWNHTIFYQVYPRSFMDADNDGVGDLKGITSKLEYFVESGIGAIWLSPINTSPMVDFGYDISDFTDIDKIFGTLTDFENLLARAKKLGLKVILDLVPNHTSDKHYWFQQSVRRVGKYSDYYIWMDGKNGNMVPPNNWLSVFNGPAWTYNEDRKQWYFHQFERRQPDLNYSNPHVQEEMEQIIEYWLRRGVDGFRVDAIPHLFETNFTSDEPKSNITDVTKMDYNYLIHTLTKDQPQTYELVKNWRKILDQYADRYNTDEKVMMTEAYTSLENTTKYYDYGSHIPFNFNFIMNVNSSSNASAFKSIIDEWMKAKPESGIANWVIGNHDRRRTATRFPERADQMTMLVMILPGVAVTYYGEEIGMIDKTDISWEETQDPQGCNAGIEKYKSRSRDPCRTPFQWDIGINAGFNKGKKPWLPIHENYLLNNLKKQKFVNGSHYEIYRALTTLRNTSDALKFGSLTIDVLNGTVLLILRKTSKEAVTLLINFSDKDKREIDLTKALEGFEGGTIKASVHAKINRTQTVELKKINLPAKASIVFLSNQTSGAPKYIASLQTILLSMFFLVITLYK